MEKDQSKLFNEIPEDVYTKAFKMLEAMRQAHPSYRDDQLLMYILCLKLLNKKA